MSLTPSDLPAGVKAASVGSLLAGCIVLSWLAAVYPQYALALVGAVIVMTVLWCVLARHYGSNAWVAVISLLLVVGIVLNLRIGAKLYLNVLLILGISYVVALRCVANRAYILLSTPLDSPMMLVLASAIASFVIASDHSSGAIALLKVLLPILFYYVIAASVRSARELRSLTYIVLASISLVCLRELFLFARGNFSMNNRIGPEVLGAWNAFGNLLLVCIALSLPLILGERRKMLKVMLLIPIGIALLLTMSRGSLLGMAVALLVVLALTVRQGGARHTALLVVLIIAMVVPVVMLQSLTVRVMSAFSIHANLIRTEIWHDALRQFAENPLLGIGPGNFHAVVSIPNHTEDVISTHNLYLQIAVDFGILGIIAWVLFYLSYLVTTARMLRRSGTHPLHYRLVVGSMAAFVGMLAASLTDTNLRVPQISWIFGLVWAIPIIVRRELNSGASAAATEA